MLTLPLLLAGPVPTTCADARAGEPALRTSVRLTCVVVNSATAETLQARCILLDALGASRCPDAPESCNYHAPCWCHDGYFYTQGTFSMDLPVGPTLIGAGHGPEFSSTADTIELTRDTLVVFDLARHTDMNSLGWYSGDCHTHASHCGGVYDLCPADMACLARAEDLNVVNVHDNTVNFIGSPDPCSGPDVIVYVTEEHRSWIYGHSDLLGITSIVEPQYSSWTPLLADIADAVHEQPGAIIIAAHPITTDDFFDIDSGPAAMGLARGLPVDAVFGKIDGFDVLSYSNYHRRGIELPMWYRLLNCGFRLVASAGTDAAMNGLYTRPLGGYRVYVALGESDLTYDSWLSGLAHGRSFVTNGPLFTDFEIAGLVPGDTLVTGTGTHELSGSVSVACSFPFTRLDIVQNGRPIESLFFEHGLCAVDTTFAVTIDESSWLAARVSGPILTWFTMGDSLFAHTGPLYVELDGHRVSVPEDAEFLAGWVADLETLAVARGEWPTPADSVKAFAAFAAARSFYEDLATGGATQVCGEEPGVGPEACLRILGARPNPSAGPTTFSLALKTPCRIVGTIHNLSGRHVRTVIDCVLSDGTHAVHWDGRDRSGHHVASGVYLFKASGGGMAATTRTVVLR